MSSRIIIAILLLLVLASVIQAQKMVIDVDRTVDFAAFKSYGWNSDQIAPTPSTSQMIVAAIERELNSRGLVRNDAAPDILIAVMAAAGMNLQAVGPSWNNERYRSWGGYGSPSALMNVSTGTLLIDLVETKSKISVWRSVVREVFVAPPTGNPTKDAAQMKNLVDKTVRRMFKKYPVNHNTTDQRR